MPLGGHVLADQRILSSVAQFIRQFQTPAQAQICITGIITAADGNTQIDNAVRVGEKDVAEASARAPEGFRDIGEFAITTFSHQLADIARQQQAQIPRVTGVVHRRVALNPIQREEGDARHHQAHHQGGHSQQFGLKAEFGPPGASLRPEPPCGCLLSSGDWSCPFRRGLVLSRGWIAGHSRPITSN